MTDLFLIGPSEGDMLRLQIGLSWDDHDHLILMNTPLAIGRTGHLRIAKDMMHDAPRNLQVAYCFHAPYRNKSIMSTGPG